MSRLATVLRLVLAELTLAIATLEWGRLYVDDAWRVPTAIALGAGALVGVATAGLVGRARLAVPLVVVVVGAVVVFFVAADGARDLGGVSSTALDGWRQLLTVVLPADATGALIGPPTIATFVCSFAAARWAWRPGPVTLPFLPTVLHYVVALPFVAAGEPGDVRRPAAAFALFAVALMVGSESRMSRTRSARPPGARPAPTPLGTARHRVGRAAFAVPALAVAVGGAWVVGHSDRVATRDPFELRSLTSPPVEVDRSLSPLAQVVAEAGQEDESFGTVTLDTDARSPAVERVGVAALGDYDGAVFTAGGDYRRAGSRLPIDDRIDDTWGTVEQAYRLEGLPWPFLPAVGVPVGVEATGAPAADIGFNAASGQLVAGKAAGGEESNEIVYEVVSRLPADADLASVASTGDEATAFSGLPQVGEAATKQLGDIRDLAKETTGTAATDREKVDALADLLRSSRYSSRAPAAGATSVPTGHSIGRIHEFLLGAPGPPGAQVGYSEQYAAALAILSRTLGIPARVMVGFDIDDVPPGSTDEERPLQSAALTAWTQVLLDTVGWVDIDPIEGANTGVVTPPETPLVAETDAGDRLDDPADCSGGAAVVDAAACPEIQSSSDGPPETASTSSFPWWGVLLVVPPVVALGLIVVAKRVRRRRRRTASTPAGRVVGAWLEVRDALVEAGHAVALEDTPAEVTAAVRDRDDPDLAEPLDELGPLVDVAVYGPTEPPEVDVEAAWLLADEFRRRSARHRSPLARVLSPVDPRPLVRRRPRTARQAASSVSSSEAAALVSVGTAPTGAESGAPRRFARRPRPTDEH